MYQLVLTTSERQAIDWIGDRYDHGTRLFKVLIHADHEIEWDSRFAVTFTLTEVQAWEVREIAEACEHRWDCFADSFARKLEEFIGRIV